MEAVSNGDYCLAGPLLHDGREQYPNRNPSSDMGCFPFPQVIHHLQAYFVASVISTWAICPLGSGLEASEIQYDWDVFRVDTLFDKRVLAMPGSAKAAIARFRARAGDFEDCWENGSLGRGILFPSARLPTEGDDPR